MQVTAAAVVTVVARTTAVANQTVDNVTVQKRLKH